MGHDYEHALEGHEREELGFLRSVVENANDAILVTEGTPTDEPGPKIVYVNETFTRMTGYALEDDGVYTHWVSVQRETTEQRREEEERRKGEEAFRAALAEQASDVVVIVGEDGALRYASPSVSNALGHRPEEVVGTGASLYVHPDDAAEALGAFREILGAPGAVGRPVELRLRRKDGSWLYFEAVGTNMIDDPAVGGGVVNAWDVTARKRVEDELRLRDRAIAASNGIIISDPDKPDNPIVYVNRRFEELTGYSAEEALGKNCRFLAEGDRDQPGVDELRIAIQEGREWSGPLRNYRKDGTPFWNELYIAPVRDEDGRVANFIGVQKDVTERKELEEKLAHQAFHDGLTDLPNRNLFLDRVGHALKRAGRRCEGVAVLFVDLDNFKVINDSLGHEVGDELLVAVAGRLSSCLRPADTAARLGGDEFVILIEDVEEPEEATHVAVRIEEELRAPFWVGGHNLFVTTSVGVALGGADGERAGDLLRNADLAMYRAKDGGKNSHAVFEPSMNAKALERLGLEADLRRALEKEEFRVHYQPKVSIKTRKIVAQEALVRWEHPERGLVPPAEFVPLAEETGLIVGLGRWVLEEACRQAKEWQDSYPSDPPLRMSVNLSAAQFKHPDLGEDVADVLRRTGLDPRDLILEITESMVVEDVGAALATLQKLKSLGIKVAVDDFGTGYSSLSYLKQFPVDYLKIDRSFVSGLGRDPKDEGLVSASIELAHALGLEAIAEGVETEEQLERLRSPGCELAQGFYFQKPSPGDAASEVLAGLFA